MPEVTKSELDLLRITHSFQSMQVYLLPTTTYGSKKKCEYARSTDVIYSWRRHDNEVLCLCASIIVCSLYAYPNKAIYKQRKRNQGRHRIPEKIVIPLIQFMHFRKTFSQLSWEDLLILCVLRRCTHWSTYHHNSTFTHHVPGWKIWSRALLFLSQLISNSLIYAYWIQNSEQQPQPCIVWFWWIEKLWLDSTPPSNNQYPSA